MMSTQQIQQNKILYLRWLATQHPDLYKATVVPIIAHHVRKTLSGLGDDTSDEYSWLSSASASDLSAAASTSSGSPLDDYSFLSTATPAQLQAAASTSSSGSSGGLLSTLSNNAGSIFSSIVSAVPTLANTYVGTQSQLNLLQVNTQRAQQGLPPLTNVNGTLVTAGQLAAPNSATAAMEHAITTGTNIPLMLMVLGGGLILALALSKKSK